MFRILSGNANEHGDVGARSGKSSLFLLTVSNKEFFFFYYFGHGSVLYGEVAKRLEKHSALFGVSGAHATTLENPWE
jgi:adenosyl cobinamide kinase/adenosyl cobinamide phosphate guanylyltransferase